MEKLQVGCAVILSAKPYSGHHYGKILIAQRKPGDTLGGYWEFPGGKCEPGEKIEDCLVREVREELGIEVLPRHFLCRTEHAYAHRTVVLHFYLCDWVSGHPIRHDVHDFRWVEPAELRSYKFPPADTEMINELVSNWTFYFRGTA
jgi:mutator protein MutT